jgi:5'-nucleotidase
MRKILIVNDDGIESDGLLRLVRESVKYGEVWIVAPEGERSAGSHSITLHGHIDVYERNYPVEGVKAYSCSGTPADCVRVGLLGVMKERPDIVFSGINRGFNSGTDLQYSGTAGAAFEAVFQGIRAIAFSEGMREHSATDEYLPKLMEEYIDMKFMPGQILNINFPECLREPCKGVKYGCKVSDSMFYRDSYRCIQELDGGGKRFVVNGSYQEMAAYGTDIRAILDGYVAVGVVKNIR